MTKDNIFMNTDVLNVSNNNFQRISFFGYMTKKVINIWLNLHFIYSFRFQSFPYKCNKDSDEINCVLNISHNR